MIVHLFRKPLICAPAAAFGLRYGSQLWHGLGCRRSTNSVDYGWDRGLSHLASLGSPEFAEPYPINALGECDLGMFAVADITAEGASRPFHRTASPDFQTGAIRVGL
jgi:hypothetical protein